MRRLIGVLAIGVLVGAGLTVRLASQGGVNALFNLRGKVDANNALVVSLLAVGTQGGVNTLANLRGKVDSNSALVVAAVANSSGNVPLPDFVQLSTVNTAAPAGTDCDAAGETGRLAFDSTADFLYICSGASGWRKITAAAP